uniref:Uncharacterized protein n=1 Tax=Faxonius propinquus nudivirus TaxID=3139431 RepID=A0AAU8GBI3_9VIRU
MQSILSNIQTIDDLKTKIYPILDFQDEFVRKIPPCEKYLWENKNLQNFKINLNEINRLYVATNKNNMLYELVARVLYKNELLFIELRAYYEDLLDVSNKCIYGGGHIYICQNANIFFHAIATKYDQLKTFDSLKKDTYVLDSSHIYNYIAKYLLHDDLNMFYDKELAKIKHLKKIQLFATMKYYNQKSKGIAENLNEYANIYEAIEDYYSKIANIAYKI